MTTLTMLMSALILTGISLHYFPVDLALIVIIVIVLSAFFLDIRSHGLIPRMAIRNSVRRPAMTALVVGGLMVGTAVISSSFVINDTLDNMIVLQAGSSFGEVDLTLASSGGGLAYLDEGTLSSLGTDIMAVEGVRGVYPIVLESVAGRVGRTGLGEPTLQVLGADEDAFIGLGGLRDIEGGNLSAPTVGTAYLNEKAAEAMGATRNDTLVLLRGNATVQLTVASVVGNVGLAGYNDVKNVIISMLDLQNLTGHHGERNLLLINIREGRPEVRDDIEGLISESYPGLGLRITSDKQETIDNSREYLQMFVMLFFVLGSFSIIAGTVLIVNIFSMLGEERKSELAVLRAVGMPRRLLRRLLMYEGLVYAALASALGAIMGVALAYVIAWAMAQVSSLTGMQLLPYFHFRFSSLMVSYGLGALVTMITTYAVVWRISRLNIVRAMRNVPGPSPARLDRRLLALGATLLISGSAMVAVGVYHRSLIPSNTGFSLLGLSVGFLGRPLMGDRWAWTASGMVTIMPWLPFPGDVRLFPYPAPTEIFVLAGLFMVTSCLLVVIFNSDLIIAGTVRLFGGRKEFRAVVRTAMSYPLRARFRTALSIFIFGLVIFTVTTMSVVSGLVGNNVIRQITETSGGYDIIAQTGIGSPLDMDPWSVIDTDDSLIHDENVTAITALPVAYAELTRNGTGTSEGDSSNTLAIGIDVPFLEGGGYPLSDWDRERFGDERGVWEGLFSDPSMAIIDGGLGGGIDQTGVMAVGEPVHIGDVITLTTSTGEVEVSVAGITKQSVLRGVFLAGSVVREGLGAQGTGLMLFRLVDGLDAGVQAALVERTFLSYGVQTIAVEELAKESAGVIDGMFSLGRGYLALGLIIGIVGLGIITMRNIRERRTEIGMMRALGYRRGMVMTNFLLESGVISMLGIVIGTPLGILVGYQLWLVTLKDSGLSFVLDWWPIIFIDGLALAATLLSVYPAARGASRIPPADVLRFE